ncbi:MAG: Npun_F0494 family protein [Cyanobacteria bacterium J06626_23]
MGSAGVGVSEQMLRRAQQAIKCSPFRMALLAEMRSQSIGLSAIAEDSGYIKGYTRHPVPELAAEDGLIWLITVGVLRREVDGQGLTDSFRLTPLGRHLLDRWQVEGCPDWQGNLMDYLLDSGRRWVRRPGWLQ